MEGCVDKRRTRQGPPRGALLQKDIRCNQNNKVGKGIHLGRWSVRADCQRTEGGRPFPRPCIYTLRQTVLIRHVRHNASAARRTQRTGGGARQRMVQPSGSGGVGLRPRAVAQPPHILHGRAHNLHRRHHTDSGDRPQLAHVGRTARLQQHIHRRALRLQPRAEGMGHAAVRRLQVAGSAPAQRTGTARLVTADGADTSDGEHQSGEGDAHQRLHLCL